MQLIGNKNGFTLIEIVVVIVILALLAALVLGVTERLPFTSMVEPLFKSKWSGNNLLSINSPRTTQLRVNIEDHSYYSWL